MALVLGRHNIVLLRQWVLGEGLDVVGTQVPFVFVGLLQDGVAVVVDRQEQGVFAGALAVEYCRLLLEVHFLFEVVAVHALPDRFLWFFGL